MKSRPKCDMWAPGMALPCDEELVRALDGYSFGDAFNRLLDLELVDTPSNEKPLKVKLHPSPEGYLEAVEGNAEGWKLLQIGAGAARVERLPVVENYFQYLEMGMYSHAAMAVTGCHWPVTVCERSMLSDYYQYRLDQGHPKTVPENWDIFTPDTGPDVDAVSFVASRIEKLIDLLRTGKIYAHGFFLNGGCFKMVEADFWMMKTVQIDFSDGGLWVLSGGQLSPLYEGLTLQLKKTEEKRAGPKEELYRQFDLDGISDSWQLPGSEPQKNKRGYAKKTCTRVYGNDLSSDDFARKVESFRKTLANMLK